VDGHDETGSGAKALAYVWVEIGGRCVYHRLGE
jgi:hypothetical protein